MELIQIANDFTKNCSQVRKNIKNLTASINSKSLPTEHGVTLLEIKNHNLLSYITNLSYYLLLKLNGKKVEDENVISKLIELRVVLEKCKPLEAKLKYQLDKLIKMATMKEDLSLVHNYDGVIDEEEETQFKPNPLGLMKEVEKKSSAEFNDDKKAEIYKPPRIAPMHYNPDERDRTKLSQKMKQKAASSRLINELRKQYDSRPEEESAEGTGYGTKEKGNKLDDLLAAKEKFQEDHFLRPNMTKADKRLQKQVATRGALLRFQNEFNDLNQDYEDIAGLQKAVEHEEIQNFGKKGILRKSKINKSHQKNFQDTDKMLNKMSKLNDEGNFFKRKVKNKKRSDFLESRTKKKVKLSQE